MHVVFWSEEDGCGMTSSMAAVASLCSNAWNMKTILIQGRNQEGDLTDKLETDISSRIVREAGPCDQRLDGLDYLLWKAKNRKLDQEAIADSVASVIRGRMYYLPQAAYRKPRVYPQALKEGMWQVIRQAEQFSDLTFVDCGSGADELSAYLLQKADAIVIHLSQERQNLDAYFQKRHAFRGRVVYVINRYQQESIYNRKNLNRLYRIPEDSLGVIPHNPIFRHASDRGKVERFVRRHIRRTALENQAYFMQELTRTAGMVLHAAGAQSKMLGIDKKGYAGKEVNETISENKGAACQSP